MKNEINAIKHTISELTVNIDKRIDDIINSYRTEASLDMSRVEALLEDMQVLSEGVYAINNYLDGIDLTELKEKLEMMMNALENSDAALFCDILQFEVKDLLDYWKDCLTK